ncbi:MAG: membrane protein insertase YidC [Planctomycetota bacterium]|nr:membrane protein insertase YidC [Planctomycetota bacterium]
MNNDSRQRIVLMLAMMVTFVVILEYVMPPPPPPPRITPERQETPVATPTLPPAATGESPVVPPAPARDFQPQGHFQIVVRNPGPEREDGETPQAYEAVFSTVGAGLSRYRLLGYWRQPGNAAKQPGGEVILLDHLANGRDSLRVDAASFGPPREKSETIGFATLNYELIEVPAEAEVTPALPADVKRGENLVFRAVAGDWEQVRTYRFPKGPEDPAFTIDMDISWRNLQDQDRSLSYRLSGPSGLLPDDNSPQFGTINFLTARQPLQGNPGVDVERKDLSTVSKAENMTSPDNRAGIAWVGAKNRFFTTLLSAGVDGLRNANGAQLRTFVPLPELLPKEPDILESLKTQPVVNAGRGDTPVFEDVSLLVVPGIIAPGGIAQAAYRFYGGPAVDSLLEQADPRFSGVISYTWHYFDFISRWLVELLTYLDRLLGNYGLAIIAVTLLVRAGMHPLNRKSMVSMSKMSKLAPLMKELQKKYASDKVRLQKEIGNLYRTNNVSMAGGCLPMFIQLPIFFALYGAFSQGFPIRHASFIPGWILDLSQPDSLYDFGWVIPVLQSRYLSLLPVLYLALQYFQMSMQPKPSDPQQASQQRMMKIMPLMFVFIFYSMPAGLVLYFAVSSLFGVLENWWIRRMVLPGLGLGDHAAVVDPSTSKAGAGAVVSSPARKKKR